MKLVVQPGPGSLAGRYRPPGDKSVSHRAAILGGLAEGRTEIYGFLDSADSRATLAAMAALGAQIEAGSEQLADPVVIHGGRLSAPPGPLNLGNSGTGMRLLAGALAGHPNLIGQEIELVGDESLSSRPMNRIIEPLALMNARIDSHQGRAPLRIVASRLRGQTHNLKIASAQVKSALLLAGLFAQGQTQISESGISRDHSERMLPAFGVELGVSPQGVVVRGGQVLRGTRIDVPGDLSSAAFAMAAGLLVDGSSVELVDVGINPSRSGVIEILNSMGADLEIAAEQTAGGEPVARMNVRASALHGVDIAPELVPLAIDELPLIMAVAATARGTTRLRGATELRVKESDRLAVMCEQLGRLGVQVEEFDDGAAITGGPISGGRVECHGDHRIAMSLAVLGLIADGPVIIDGAEWIATSYPRFVEDMRALGAGLEWQ